MDEETYRLLDKIKWDESFCELGEKIKQEVRECIQKYEDQFDEEEEI